MTREEVLNKARKQNNNREFENRGLAKSLAMGNIVGLIALTLITFVNYLKYQKVNIDGFIIFFSIMGTAYLLAYKTSDKKSDLLIGIAFLIFTILLFLGFISL